MNWVQFKDLVSHMCLAGAVVAFWSLTQKVAGSSPFAILTNISVTEFAKFSETFMKNSNRFRSGGPHLPRNPGSATDLHLLILSTQVSV